MLCHAQDTFGEPFHPFIDASCAMGKPYRPCMECLMPSCFLSCFLPVWNCSACLWLLQRHNEQKLQEAFERSKDVFLIFSVNMSGHFQGYARMVSVGNQNQVCWVDSVCVCAHPEFPVMIAYRCDTSFSFLSVTMCTKLEVLCEHSLALHDPGIACQCAMQCCLSSATSCTMLQ